MNALKKVGFFLLSLAASLAICLVIAAAAALADVDPGTVVIPNGEFLLGLFQSLGGFKGASALAIAALVVQLVMKGLQTEFVIAQVPGKFRLIAVYLLSLVLGVVGLMIAGVSLPAALVHSQTLVAFQVLLNQVFKQFFTEKGNIV